MVSRDRSKFASETRGSIDEDRKWAADFPFRLSETAHQQRPQRPSDTLLETVKISSGCNSGQPQPVIA